MKANRRAVLRNSSSELPIWRAPPVKGPAAPPPLSPPLTTPSWAKPHRGRPPAGSSQILFCAYVQVPQALPTVPIQWDLRQDKLLGTPTRSSSDSIPRGGTRVGPSTRSLRQGVSTGPRKRELGCDKFIGFYDIVRHMTNIDGIGTR